MSFSSGYQTTGPNYNTLRYNNITQLFQYYEDLSDTWNNVIYNGGVNYLDDLLDVSISSPSTSQILQYNGSQWVNNTILFLPTGTNLHNTLRWDGTDWVETNHFRVDDLSFNIYSDGFTFNGTYNNLFSNHLSSPLWAFSSSGVNYNTISSNEWNLTSINLTSITYSNFKSSSFLNDLNINSINYSSIEESDIQGSSSYSLINYSSFNNIQSSSDNFSSILYSNFNSLANSGGNSFNSIQHSNFNSTSFTSSSIGSILSSISSSYINSCSISGNYGCSILSSSLNSINISGNIHSFISSSQDSYQTSEIYSSILSSKNSYTSSTTSILGNKGGNMILGSYNSFTSRSGAPNGSMIIIGSDESDLQNGWNLLMLGSETSTSTISTFCSILSSDSIQITNSTKSTILSSTDCIHTGLTTYSDIISSKSSILTSSNQSSIISSTSVNPTTVNYSTHISNDSITVNRDFHLNTSNLSIVGYDSGGVDESYFRVNQTPTNRCAGKATLVAGTVAVSNSTVSPSTMIIITPNFVPLGVLYAVPGAGNFSITSTNAGDAGDVSYLIINDI